MRWIATVCRDDEDEDEDEDEEEVVEGVDWLVDGGGVFNDENELNIIDFQFVYVFCFF